MNSRLYHCAPIILGPGSIIHPGNWGRIKQQFEVDGVSIAREVILEHIRQKEFSDKPSRLQANFACPTIETAKSYLDEFSKTNLIYEIELVEPAASHHTGDHKLCMKGFIGINGMEQIARDYWTAENSESPEFVTLSPLKVIKRIR